MKNITKTDKKAITEKKKPENKLKDNHKNKDILDNIETMYTNNEEAIYQEIVENNPSLENIQNKISEKAVIFDTTINEPVITKPVFEDKTNSLNDNKSRVEAILFAIGKYLDEDMLVQLCELDKRQVKKALEELRKDYDSRNNALMITQEENRWKINVREKYLSLVRKVVSDTELSKSILETLSIIAWKTPVYQNEVVRIRGNKCYDHIEELEKAGFITKDKKGRSYVLKTTDKFYNYFDIDQKNLKGVMSEAKMPEKQATLIAEAKPEEPQAYSREKLLQALETIETKSIVKTQDDADSEKNFLEQIHKKIEDASKRTDEVIAELPHDNKDIKPEETVENEAPATSELQNENVIESGEDIIINTETADDVHAFQKPQDQINKPKALTRKQLEKKFKDELQRVKDKTVTKGK